MLRHIFLPMILYKIGDNNKLLHNYINYTNILILSKVLYNLNVYIYIYISKHTQYNINSLYTLMFKTFFNICAIIFLIIVVKTYNFKLLKKNDEIRINLTLS